MSNSSLGELQNLDNRDNPGEKALEKAEELREIIRRLWKWEELFLNPLPHRVFIVFGFVRLFLRLSFSPLYTTSS